MWKTEVLIWVAFWVALLIVALSYLNWLLSNECMIKMKSAPRVDKEILDIVNVSESKDKKGFVIKLNDEKTITIPKNRTVVKYEEESMRLEIVSKTFSYVQKREKDADLMWTATEVSYLLYI